VGGDRLELPTSWV